MISSRRRPTAMISRLGRQEGELIDRSRRLSFTFNGVEHRGFDGDTIVSALMAEGERIFSRSFKYHRPRSVLSATFHDPGCIVQVGDEPNVRAAHRRLRDGMAVEAQTGWPSLRYDVGAANQLVGRFIGAGFYYKTFIKPQRLWPTYEKVLQRFAAGGRVQASSPHGTYDKRYAHPDVLVAGGGPAGMAAALGAADAGANVILVEEEYELGGHLRFGGSEDLVALRELRDEVGAHAGIEVMTNSVVTGRYDDNWVAVLQRELPQVAERLVKARAKTLVVASGLIERPYVFEGNDLPGVMLSTAARRLVNLYAVKPGQQAVVFAANESGQAAAADLDRVGVEVLKVVDPASGGELVRALGRGQLEQVELGDGSIVDCDLLVTAVGWTAPTLLVNMAGDRPRYDERAARFVPGGALPDTVLATGGIVGDGPLQALVAHGRATGTAAAHRALGRADSIDIPELEPAPHPALFRARTHGIVDYSEDVYSKDLVAAAREGYDSVELLKRYTTATMGPSQGKLETINTVAVLAEATGRSIEETGTTVWRPPYAPISLGALAGRILEPVRYSPMQPWHDSHGAKPIVAGQWIRPEHYGDAAAEVRNVRENVGIIDVSPLGKLDLRGPDVSKLLNFVYVNKWSKLDVGSVRYGVMCGEDGVVIDDGVTGRLAADHYFMSTTSSGAQAVHEWVENWLQTSFPSWQVHVTSMVSAYASINIAGPRSRELLGRLVPDVDLSPESFSYMQVRTGTIAGVPGCHMWRIGFTGELSFEIHVPAGYGLYVWERLMSDGKDLGVGPFGLEAQRVMRLEKGHFIVGQDTDGVTQALSAGLDWLVKLDKEDFAGKPELVWQHERGDGMRLVGLQPSDTHLVPAEASQIVSPSGAIEGRITSSRFSPTIGRSICLGLVSARLAVAGTVVTVKLPDGRHVPATVMEHHAHFDPEGSRLRG
ncbi:MAG: 2Fe-2S iron-sulfur cluster-binding protein [Actinomycetota bacterium]|jgi:sarcosine oxidase subunit alpha|nr:2Fe-2S iron-sulfur cluster-binding protein [Actinomycetota bacterium]